MSIFSRRNQNGFANKVKNSILKNMSFKSDFLIRMLNRNRIPENMSPKENIMRKLRKSLPIQKIDGLRSYPDS